MIRCPTRTGSVFAVIQSPHCATLFPYTTLVPIFRLCAVLLSRISAEAATVLPLTLPAATLKVNCGCALLPGPSAPRFHCTAPPLTAPPPLAATKLFPVGTDALSPAPGPLPLPGLP